MPSERLPIKRYYELADQLYDFARERMARDGEVRSTALVDKALEIGFGDVRDIEDAIGYIVAERLWTIRDGRITA